ncbi:hypothetical protein MPSEU_000967300 [Mayamaea pseudoterrestris]|nr:hypothetical protein MPSEU_000967300 [Mayamaea pseudoterrestris]
MTTSRRASNRSKPPPPPQQASNMANDNSASSSNDNEMKIIHPSPDEDFEALEILRKLDARLERYERRFIQLIDEEKDQSVRRIQGKRFEVFCSSTYKPCNAFDELCMLVAGDDDQDESTLEARAQQIKERMINFAIKQAGKDERFPSSRYSYNNFSLLITYDAVDAQGPHIDLLYPNAQFGLLLTNSSPGTISYKVKCNIICARDLPKHVASWKNAPPKLLDAMSNEESGAAALIRSFGDTLHVQLKAVKTKLLHCGDCTSLPGSLLHAGPSCPKFRAILFYSATPRDGEHEDATSIAEYDPDTQYFGALLLADICPVVWPALDDDSKVFMLERLAEYAKLAKKQHVRNVYSHVNQNHFCHAFLQSIEYSLYKKDGFADIHDFIKAEAKTQRTVFLSPVVQGESVSLDKLEKISISRLYTIEENGTAKPFRHQISVYKDLTERLLAAEEAAAESESDSTATKRIVRDILIHYHADGCWEGHNGGYTLETPVGTFDLFNGSNGVLRASGGEVIPCFPGNVGKRKRV